MPYCSNCGAEVDEGETYCHNCGGRQSQRGDQGPEGRTKGGRRGQRGGGRGQGQRGGHGQQQRGQGQQPGGPPDGGGGRGQPAGGGQPRPQDTNGLLGFALGYPKRDGWAPTLISGLLIIGSFLIVPAFMLLGYGFRVARAAALGHRNPPSYDDWGGLIVDGLRFFAMYLLLAILVGIPLLVVQLAIAASESVVLLVLYFVLSFVAGYASLAFLTAFVGSNSIGDALTNGQAINLLKTGLYVKAFLLQIVLQFIIGVVFILSVFTIIGWIFVYGYSVLALGAYWGFVYYQAAQEGIVSPPVGGGQQRGQRGQQTRQQRR